MLMCSTAAPAPAYNAALAATIVVVAATIFDVASNPADATATSADVPYAIAMNKVIACCSVLLLH